MIKAISDIILISALVLLAYIDYKKKIIPNKILFIMFALRLVLMIVEMFENREFIDSILISSFLALIVGGGVFIFVALVLKNSIGMGDVKLVAVIGFYVGIENLFSLIITSLLICLIIASSLMLAKKINSKEMIPFAPFLMLGTLLCLVFKL